MKTSSLFAGLAVAGALIAAPAGAVTVVNGSFETATLNPGVFTTLFAGSTAIDGWTVGGHSIDYIGTYWEPGEGSRSIDLAGNDKGSISQLLTGLTVGGKYQVHFLLAGNPDGGGSTKVAVVTDGGMQSENFSFDQPGNTKADMGWTEQVFAFTATATTANLTFGATLNNAFGPALDNVSITGGAVPEPASWALMIAGFGAVGSLMRRRRALTA